MGLRHPVAVLYSIISVIVDYFRIVIVGEPIED